MDDQLVVLNVEDVLARYEQIVPPNLTNTLTRKGEMEMAQAICASISDDLAKNAGNPRATLLEVGAALMSLSVHNVALAVQLSSALTAAEAAMYYSAGALKREAFMVGGWVLFGCSVVAYIAGWL